VPDAGPVDAVEDQVGKCDGAEEVLLFAAVEGAVPERVEVFGG
jgi:hypothetical protein